ncbi:MAG: type II secretion system protein GspG [Pontiellaceae bacterium]|nr:type II secretion system protein GspG [Pontiellaceae bacterium]
MEFVSALPMALVLLLGATLPQKPATESVKPIQTVQTAQPVRAELTQLDLDGDFLLFMDTSSVKARINQYIDMVADVVKVEAPAEEVDSIVGLVKKGIDESGLLSVDSFAMSSKPLENGLTRSISVLDYGEEDADTMLWRVLVSEPKTLCGVQYAPADTVFLVNSTANLGEVWKIFNEVTADYLPPEVQAELKEQIAMLEMMIGTEFDELFGSLDNEILVSVQLSNIRKCVIPLDGEMTLAIPEPSAVIGLQTKNPMLSQLLLEHLKQAGAPLVETELGDLTLHSIYLPEPLPLSFAPTLLQTEDYLLIGSNPETVAKALESREKKNGLISTPNYKKLMADAPEQVSAVSYLSPRLTQAYGEVVKRLIDESGEEQIKAVFKPYLANIKELQFGKYVLKTPTGIYAKTYSNVAVNPGELIVAASVGHLGLLGGIAVPRVASRSEQVRTMEGRANVSTLEIAIMEYEMMNGEYPVTLNDLLDESKGGPYLQKNRIPTDPWGNPYSFCAPGTHNTHSFDLWSVGHEDEINNWD